MVGVEILQKSEPYNLPGYTGYCPQHKFICGRNFGDLTHKLLVDPSVNHAEKLALFDNTKDYEVVKPTKGDIEIVKARSERIDPIYKHPMVPGYGGYVPNMGAIRDRPFEVQATLGLAKFERQQLKRQASLDRLKKTVELQCGVRDPKNLEERLLLESKFRLPLIEVRPECAGFVRSQPVNELYERPKDYNTSPYFMENSNPQKYFINGYTGYTPYRSTHFGKPHKKMATDGLRDFTSNYLHKKRIDWAPVIISKKKGVPRSGTKNHEIYKRDAALMPTYTGHVPGAMFKIGKTYGCLSKNANKYIEEHLFMLKLKCDK